MKCHPAALAAVVLCALAALPAWGQQPAAMQPVESINPVAGEVLVRVPAGIGAQSSPGADMTAGLVDSFPSGSEEGGTEAGQGEWVFVPIPFKSALLGAGVQVGAGRLYKPVDRPQQEHTSMFGVGGMYAEGGSWAAAAGDRRYWGQQSRFRSTVIGGVGKVSYPVVVGDDAITLTLPLEQDFKGGVLQVGYEIRDKLWLSAGFKYATTEVTTTGLEVDTEPPPFVDWPPLFTTDVASLRLSVERDSRSDQFYPRDGSQLSAEVAHADPAYGSDSRFTVYELSYNGYRPMGERHTLAWRLAGKSVAGDPPFFALAWFGSGVDLRGYTPGTYIGETYAAAQAEWRWQATERIGLVAFGGVGGVWGDLPAFEQDDFLPAGGVGLRWRLTEKFRVNFRIDYAWGKDDEVLLISVGEAF